MSASVRWKKFPFKIGLLQSGRYTIIEATQLSEHGIAVMAPFEPGKNVLITLRIPGHPLKFLRSTFENTLADKSSVLKFDKLELSDKRALRSYVVSMSLVRS
ncbi:MAG: hypothetical protein K2X47_03815 [Bdellovibrionales bacterium]|nr:hypothetical protein [Bdellovibrionales bacterium]